LSNRALMLLAWMLVSAEAGAYEGASIHRDAADAGTPHTPQLTKAPELLKFVEATYPPEMLAQKAGLIHRPTGKVIPPGPTAEV
jgi:hypothetical protein